MSLKLRKQYNLKDFLDNKKFVVQKLQSTVNNSVINIYNEIYHNVIIIDKV